MSLKLLGLNVSYVVYSVPSYLQITHRESATCRRGQITNQSREIANNILWANEQIVTIDGAPIESLG